jgi:hypothetical protein
VEDGYIVRAKMGECSVQAKGFGKENGFKIDVKKVCAAGAAPKFRQQNSLRGGEPCIRLATVQL